MDLQTLSHLFATTYNPDPNVRKSAELQIRKVMVNPQTSRVLVSNHSYFIKVGGEEGMVAALLQIIAADSVDMYVSNAFVLCIHAPAMLTDLS
jgi:importin-7